MKPATLRYSSAHSGQKLYSCSTYISNGCRSSHDRNCLREAEIRSKEKTLENNKSQGLLYVLVFYGSECDDTMYLPDDKWR